MGELEVRKTRKKRNQSQIVNQRVGVEVEAGKVNHLAIRKTIKIKKEKVKIRCRETMNRKCKTMKVR